MQDERVVRCFEAECQEPATYKIAAPWSDGRFWELKTYGFACAAHLKDVLRSAEARWLAYEPVRGEIVQDICIYRYEPGKTDRQLVRDREIEESIRTWST
jgi:hypothetical protein